MKNKYPGGCLLADNQVLVNQVNFFNRYQYLTLFFLVIWFLGLKGSQAQAQTITGPQTVTSGQTATYYLSGPVDSTAFWSIYGGEVKTFSLSSVQILWIAPAGTNGSVTYDGSVVYANLQVTINGSTAPTPTGANINNPIIVPTLSPCTPYSNTANNSSFNNYGNDYGQNSDDIYYKVSLTDYGQIEIGHCSSGFDTYLHLLNYRGENIASNDDNGPLCAGTRSSIAMDLSPGVYYVVSEGYNGSTGDITTTIKIKPTAQMEPFAPVCVSAAPFALSGASPLNGSYSGPGVTNGTFNPAAAGVGTHTITYSYSANGCSTSTTKTIQVEAIPSLSITGNTTFCAGSSTTLTASTGSSFSWSTGATGRSITVRAAGTYSVTITTSSGCRVAASVNVTQNAIPAVAINTHTGTTGTTLTAFVTNNENGSFSWSPAAGLNTTTGAVVTANPTVNTTYTVTATHANGCTATALVRVNAGSNNYNYVKANVILEAGKTTEAQLADLTVEQQQQSINYLDGLGREIQSVMTQGSPAKKDIVQPIGYDQYGRKDKNYLPYSDGINGYYKLDAIIPEKYPVSKQYQFYQGNTPMMGKYAGDTAPYAVSVFDGSPLNQVIKQGATGLAWQPDAYAAATSTDRSVKILERTNANNEVRLWIYNFSTAACSAVGFYAANELLVTETRDEHQSRTVEYKDKTGRVLLKKVQESLTPPVADGDYLMTYYVYDDFNNLRLVIPPQAVRQMPASWAPDPAFVKNWCFSYNYDGKKRLIEKQVPGAGWVFMVYDNRDRLVLTQDAKQRGAASPEWHYTHYDELNRPLITGIFRPGTQLSQQEMQRQLDPTFNFTYRDGALIESNAYEGVQEYVATQAITLLPGFEVRAEGSQTFTARIGSAAPLDVVSDINKYEELTRTYYDQYSNPALAGKAFVPEAGVTNDANATSNKVSNRVKGQITGQQVKVLGATNTWLTTVNYYDDNYRLLQSISDNNLGGTDRMTSRYDFAGKVKETLVTQTKGSGETYVVQNTFHYDHGGRLLETKQHVGTAPVAAPSIIVAKHEYNELGQLVDKKLHSTNNGGNYLQSVDHRYNIRGWLTHINNRDLKNDNNTNDDNNDVFGLELKYQDDLKLGTIYANRQQFNGNISEALWRSASDNVLRGYSYEYDKLNRLKNANYRAAKDYANSWTEETDRFTTSNLTYDGNGNIKSMTRRGLIAEVNGLKTYGVLDNLTYQYDAGKGNQLMGVDDKDSNGNMIATATSHDFEDKNSRSFTTGPEYSYDANGNLIRDDNKGITGILYNHLNLPYKIDFGSGNYLEYSYTATGTKLQKRVYTSSILTSTTDYAGSLVYEKEAAGPQKLSFVHTAEGRVVYQPTVTGKPWKYEYFLKDHLGNTRVAVGEPEEEVVVATAESEYLSERGYFTGLDQTRAPVATALDHTHLTATPTGANTEVIRLNRGRNVVTKPGRSFHVMPGDKVKTKVYAKYLDLRSNTSTPDITTLVSAISGAAGYSVVTDAAGSTITGPGGALVGSLKSAAASASNAPLAYLKYYLYDDNYNPISSGQAQVTGAAAVWDAASLGAAHQELSLTLPNITQAGYVKIELSHERAEDVDIYFDDLTVSHEHIVVQENHYDPWGQNLVGIEKQGKPDHKFQYNGKEKQEEFGLNWNDYGWRNYDYQIARWHNVDPHAFNYLRETPYAYVSNKPTIAIDPDGRDVVFSVTRDKKTNEITGVNISAKVIITGEGANEGRADDLNKASSEVFQSKSINGVKISFDIKFAYQNKVNNKALNPGDNVLNFISKMSVGKDRSHVKGFINEFGEFTGRHGEIYKDRWDDNGTIFHEALHFTGLSDRYDKSYDDKQPPLDGERDDIMEGSENKRISTVQYRAYYNYVTNQNMQKKYPNGKFLNRVRVDTNKDIFEDSFK